MVQLTQNEVLACLHQASQRITASEAQGLNHASTYRRPILERIAQDLDGALGERAFAKWLGVYHGDGINTFHGPDCLVYQVRSTHLDDGCLIVRDRSGRAPEDDPDSVYVLAIVGRSGAIRLSGWIFGYRARKDEWLKDPHGHRPSWFVPQSSLRTMDTLPRVIA